jgi:hypothetical protein
MGKPILTSKQAEALEKSCTLHRPDEIVVIHVEEGFVVPNYCLNDLPLDTLIRALYIGYEVELTEQEKLQEIWGEKEKPIGEFLLKPRRDMLLIYREGIKDTLKALGREDLIPKPEEEN